MRSRIVFLVSGQGGNLRFLLEARRYGLFGGDILHVIADRNCGAVRCAEAAGIPCQIVRYTKDNPEELLLALQPYSAALIITNIHKILSPEIILEHSGRLLNLHYSVLPSFGGLIGMATVQAALATGCTVIGSSAHLVTEQLDAGPIVAQGVLPTTNLCQERLIELTFRNGCLVLLNAIRLLSRPREQLASAIYCPEFGLLAPGPDYDLSVLNESFWKAIKKGT